MAKIMRGSLISRLMEQSKQPDPEVGMGATLCGYTDRQAATVVRVSATGKTIWLQEDRAERTDKNGMSECQTYRYTPDKDAPLQRAMKLKMGGWKVVNGRRVVLGVRDQYHDYSY